ncbi:2Fe-2S iron-sulfur cluster-binding protein [Streptomyces nigra]
MYARRARPVDAGRTLAAASTATRSDLRRSRSSGRLRAGVTHPAARSQCWVAEPSSGGARSTAARLP